MKVSDTFVFMGEAAGEYRSEIVAINLLLFCGPSVSDIISFKRVSDLQDSFPQLADPKDKMRSLYFLSDREPEGVVIKVLSCLTCLMLKEGKIVPILF